LSKRDLAVRALGSKDHLLFIQYDRVERVIDLLYELDLPDAFRYRERLKVFELPNSDIDYSGHAHANLSHDRLYLCTEVQDAAEAMIDLLQKFGAEWEDRLGICAEDLLTDFGLLLERLAALSREALFDVRVYG